MSERPIRYWPALLILGLMLVALAAIWIGDTNNRQFMYMKMMGTTAIGLILLILWALTLSRLPGRTRLWIAGAVAVMVLAASTMLKITGVTGNLIPIVSWRWSGTDLGSATATAPVEDVNLSNFPRFLGPSGNAVIQSPPLQDWSTHPPKERWRISVGEGWSAFSISGPIAVTQEQRGEDECVVAYDLLTGAERWVHATNTKYATTIGGTGPRATPTIQGNRVYAMGATGWLTCLDLDTGDHRWSRNTAEENGAKIPDWGYAGSPLLTDGKVIVSPGGRDDNSLVAYDAHDGTLVWSGGSRRAGYSSPARHLLAGRDQIIVFNHGQVAGHDAETGKPLWTTPWEMPGGNQCVAQPLPMGDNRLFVTTGYGVGCKLYELVESEDGLDAEIIYETPRMKAKFTQVVLHEGYLYGLDDGVLVCLDPTNGERMWKRGRYGHGQILLAGDALIVQTEDGDVILVDPNPEKLVERGRIPALDSKTWNNPVLAGSLLIVRNDREAVCYEVALKEEAL